ncbi:DUF998 domain-containing protein [Niabella sp. CC-SYL272]|uniref:DUF998 domain-containing protein n=1 Tax=Niabella agricola TaxID=2891571 RepID=UPI001F3D21DA|nr:DUF998 domain-containing protein [Niabella agricola]MCF3108134.1 DUF998 domain-containing protein [Niabella agricola]
MRSLSLYDNKALPPLSLMQKMLLCCGILSSVVYIAANVICVLLYKNYSPVSQTVSELSAIGAPTRKLWVSLMVPYSLLMVVFGWGVRQSARGYRRLEIVGIILIANAVIGFFWPPMHQREVLAAGGATLSDTLHIVFTIAAVFLIILAIAFGGASLSGWFRIYSAGTLVTLVVAGLLSSIGGSKIAANLPTPWIGIWERINIGVFMLWIIILAVALLRRKPTMPPGEIGNMLSDCE